ncbi:hypothetical protein AOLI_G00079640 [Acnodon oligacanthus]
MSIAELIVVRPLVPRIDQITQHIAWPRFEVNTPQAEFPALYFCDSVPFTLPPSHIQSVGLKDTGGGGFLAPPARHPSHSPPHTSVPLLETQPPAPHPPVFDSESSKRRRYPTRIGAERLRTSKNDGNKEPRRAGVRSRAAGLQAGRVSAAVAESFGRIFDFSLPAETESAHLTCEVGGKNNHRSLDDRLQSRAETPPSRRTSAPCPLLDGPAAPNDEEELVRLEYATCAVSIRLCAARLLLQALPSLARSVLAHPKSDKPRPSRPTIGWCL